MGSATTRSNALVAATAMVVTLAACDGNGGSDTTAPSVASSAASSTTTTAPTTTTGTAPAADVVARFGDRAPVVRAIQFYLVCNGYTRTVVDGLDKDLVPDGVYGQITANLVDSAQKDLGMARHEDIVDSELYLRLADDCPNVRSVYLAETNLSVDAGGYAGPDHTDTWTLWATEGQSMTITAADPLIIGLTEPDGDELVAPSATDGLELDVAATGSHTVTVTQNVGGPYRVTVAMPPLPTAVSLQSNGLGIVDFGASPDEVIGLLTGILGEPDSTTTWIESPGCIRWRRTEWGEGLWVYITDVATAWGSADVQHFAAWRAAAPDRSAGFPRLETPSGLAVGDGAARVEEVYGDLAEIDGTAVSIVDGIIVGELEAPDGPVARLSAGVELCPGDAGPEE
jgi:hypothetical protein